MALTCLGSNSTPAFPRALAAQVSEPENSYRLRDFASRRRPRGTRPRAEATRVQRRLVAAGAMDSTTDHGSRSTSFRPAEVRGVPPPVMHVRWRVPGHQPRAVLLSGTWSSGGAPLFFLPTGRSDASSRPLQPSERSWSRRGPGPSTLPRRHHPQHRGVRAGPTPTRRSSCWRADHRSTRDILARSNAVVSVNRGATPQEPVVRPGAGPPSTGTWPTTSTTIPRSCRGVTAHRRGPGPTPGQVAWF